MIISKTNNLQINIFNKVLKNPLLLGSGTLIERFQDIQPFLDANIGGVIPRSTRYTMDRKTHPIPHLYQSGSRQYPSMINSEWTGADIHYWRPYLEQMANSESIAMSISGRNIADCVTVCKELDKFNSWLFLEINLSCAHSNHVHGMITRDANHIKNLIDELKNANIKTPIALKLGYSEQLIELCQVAKDAGADAIVAINTFGPVFDFYINNHGKPEKIVGIKGAKGGLSGAPILQIALTAIAEIKTHVDIDIIGCGGISTAEDVIKMLMAGASLVQVYSAAHVKGINAPQYFKSLLNNIERYIKDHHIKNLASVIGMALPLLNQPTEINVKIPSVNKDTCIGCDLCIPVCLPKAISIEPSTPLNDKHTIKIDENKCIGCGHCVHVCPTTPNTLSFE